MIHTLISSESRISETLEILYVSDNLFKKKERASLRL